MKKVSKATRRIFSFFVAFALVFSCLPIVEQATALSATAPDIRVSDPSTMDAWKNLFGPTQLTTEHAGTVWTDKSVFTDASAFGETGVSMNGTNDSFLVALSAMASNSSTIGMSHVPTDTMFVLDVSGSMNDSNNKLADEMVEAANESIATLLSSNPLNRVGVVLYSDEDDDTDHSILLLPLNNYITASDGQYLNYTKTVVSSGGGKGPGGGGSKEEVTETVSLDPDVRIAGTNSVPTVSDTSKVVVGATYIQHGLNLAKNQFTAATNTTTVQTISGTTTRMPIMVLITDGAPTYGTTNFTNPGDTEFGNGSDTSDALGFVTQLTAAYVKQQIETKYGTDCLFYTMGLGVGSNSVAKSVVDPANSSTAINSLWSSYQNASIGSSVKITTGKNERTVKKISQALEKAYADAYFAVSGSSADLAAGLKKAFADIVAAIQLKSLFPATLVEGGNDDLSGYVSFVDKVGTYMQVTDIKGILMHGNLHTGAALSKNFIDGGVLGTVENPTELGRAFIAALQHRLGISNPETMRTLVSLAYEHGQLSYTSDSNFSNYIGTYNNAAGEFLGFWHEGSTTTPEDAVYITKSYVFLGHTITESGITDSDTMYAVVYVRENIQTGEQSVAFGVPASLLPTSTYEVILDEDHNLTDLKVSGSTEPIRLVYEVALDSEIDELTILDPNVVSSDYLAANTNADGSVSFYSNQYEIDNSTGYGKVNTYAYFQPAHENSHYYCTEDTPIYSDTNGTLAVGALDTNGTYYRAYTVYVKNGSTLTEETHYRQISAAAVATAEQNPSDNTWYLTKGTVYVNTDGYENEKNSNPTGTLIWANEPFVDINGHSVDEADHLFYVGATLGNNGALSVFPTTGMLIRKSTVNVPEEAANATFQFTISSDSETTNGKTYSALHISATRVRTTTTVTFKDGSATVALKPGESLYVTGMTAGNVYTVQELAHDDYALYSVDADPQKTSATLTLVANKIVGTHFVNTVKSNGNLTISKEVLHSLGADVTFTNSHKFKVTVTLIGDNTANQKFTAASSADASIDSITTDANGKFEIALGHLDHFHVYDLPDGTVATVVETLDADADKGFSNNDIAYSENHVAAQDGVVTIVGDTTTTVGIQNTYKPASVNPVNLSVSGTKTFTGNDWTTETFTVSLQRATAEGHWETIASKTLSSSATTYTFDDILANENYDHAGTYNYQIIETNGGSTIDGITYDAIKHTFGVTIGDTNFDGQLEITNVIAYNTNTDFTFTATDNTWVRSDFDFTNTYHSVGTTLSFDVQKTLKNDSKSPLGVLSGYQFILYEGETEIAKSTLTDGIGEAQFILEYVKADEGTHTYTLKEIAGTANGITYSSAEYEIVVTVTDAAGITSAEITSITQTKNDVGAVLEIPVQLQADATPAFRNVYTPTTANLYLTATKALTGRDMIPGEFTFAIRESGSTTNLVTATNGSDGSIAFPALPFSTVGTFHYDVVEITQDGNGITADKTVHSIQVTVTDVNGTLTAQWLHENELVDTITFHNTYKAEATEHSISGTKTLNGKALMNDEFVFILTEANRDGTIPTGAKTWTAYNTLQGTFAFAPITYDAAGTYYYVVSEQQASAEYGITFDTTKYLVTITVTDNGLGNLQVAEQIQILDGNAVSAITFTNTYTPAPTTATIPGSKNLEGKVLTSGDFSFELYESNDQWTTGALKETVENNDSGRFYFSELEFDTAGTYYYLVKETNGGQTIDGITYDDTVYRVTITVTDNQQGRLIAQMEVTDENGVAQDNILFVNVYAIESGITLPISGTKLLTGRDIEDGEFTFELYKTDSSFTVSGTPVTTVNDGNDFLFNLDYTPDDAGETFYYVLQEANAGKSVNGVVYDASQYHITVLVEDNDRGGLKTTVTLTKNGETVDTIGFANTYSTAPTSIQIVGTKDLTGRDIIDGEFTFELYETDSSFAVSGTPTTTVNDGNDFLFDLDYTPDDAGRTFYYVLKEADAGATINGIAYDASRYHITVLVEDDGLGNLKTTVTITKNGETVDTIGFANVYSTAPTSIQIAGTKDLIGRDIVDGEFTFELYETDSSFAVSGTPTTTVNDGNDFLFDLDYTPDDAGKTFYYVLKEANAGKIIDGIAYDASRYHITVLVEDDGLGNLKTTVTITKNGETVDTIGFANVYSTAPTSIQIAGTKDLIGRDIVDGEFTFELYETGSSFAVSGTPTTTVNDGNDFLFDLDYTPDDAGKTFYYVLKEANAGATINGITYDASLYHITVLVEDDGLGNLKTTVTITVDGETVSAIGFVNIYSSDPAAICIAGVKRLDGKLLLARQFKFELYESNAQWQTGDLLDITYNDALGGFAFSSIVYEETGTYYYLVKEANRGNIINGTAYDTTIYRVKVEVVDDQESGQLRAVVTLTDTHGIPHAGIVFVNTYKVRTGTNVTISGNKNLVGRDILDGEFAFELYETDSAFTVSSKPITVTNKDNAFRFDLSYKPEDAGKTFYYVLREANAGQTINGVTYDASEYRIVVQVLDNGMGGLNTIVTIKKGGFTEKTICFKNTYKAAPTDITLDGTKVLEGIRDLYAGDFIFDIYNADASFVASGAPLQSVANDANGSFSFADIVLNEAKTYYFVVKENSETAIGGVTYDGTVYHVTVVVKDDGLGKLYVDSVLITDSEGNTVDSIHFTNTYSATDATINLDGVKVLNGRELLAGEFAFLLYETDSTYQIAEDAIALKAVNKADGTFTFDALTYSEEGIYYYVIVEDTSVAAERVTMDGTVYHVFVEAKDNGNGSLIASAPVIVKQGSDAALDRIVFTNIFTPKPDDLAIMVDIHKVVTNLSAETIGPEGFTFTLEDLNTGETYTVKTDENGLAAFLLKFTEEHIGMTFTYRLTEVNNNQAYVIYSDAVYDMTITITLSDDNKLVAEVTLNGETVEAVVAEFENIYNYAPPVTPPTGDESHLVLWFTMMAVSALGLFMILFFRKRRAC